MTEPTYLAETRTAYDTVAASYAELVGPVHEGPSLDRAMLAAFAELVLSSGGGKVADLGCGPGRITTHLRDLGLAVFGIDLSPGMVEVARQRHPDIQFRVGSISALDLKDGELAGIVAWYSIIHTPPELLPTVFAEFHRTLAPGGHLALAFQSGDERRHLEQAYGHEVTYDSYRLPPDHIAEMFTQAGFVESARMVRERRELEKCPQAFLIARKPAVEA